MTEDGYAVFYDGELPADAPENAETGTVEGGVIGGGGTSGIYFSVDYGNMILSSGTISGNGYDVNELGDLAGGISMDAEYGEFYMTGGSLSYNVAVMGGGLLVAAQEVLIEGGEFYDNMASSLMSSETLKETNVFIFMADFEIHATINGGKFG